MTYPAPQLVRIAFAVVLLGLLLSLDGCSRRIVRPLPSCDYNTARPHNACGDPLLDTPEVAVYWSTVTRSRARFTGAAGCHRANRFVDAPLLANVSLVFKTADKHFAVTMDDAYKRLIERQILPAIVAKGCTGSPFEQVFVAHYLEQVRISGGTGPIYTDPSSHYSNNTPHGIYVHGEIPLSSTVIAFDRSTPKYGVIQSPAGTDPVSLAKMIENRTERQAIEASLLQARARQEEERFKKSITDLKEGFAKFGRAIEPVLGAMDRLEEEGADGSGVFYQNDLRAISSRPSGTLCNAGQKEMRIAAAVEFSPRLKIFDLSAPTEIWVRGWGILPPGSCKTVVTSAGNLAILRIEIKVSDQETRPALYEGDGDAASVDLSVNRNRLLRTDKIALCVKRTEPFERRTETTAQAAECRPGEERIVFPYVFQFSNDHHLTLNLQ